MQTLTALLPTEEELSSLSKFERRAFLLVHKMNQGRWKTFWTWCQKAIGALWIDICTYNLMTIYGLENLDKIDPSKPVLLVANHRSFFDMYVVSAMLYKYTKWKKRLYFPVRGRFFYQCRLGLFVNFVMGFWSMYPPFFYEPAKKAFDSYSTKRLLQLCSSGAGHVIGFHPEGTRNKNPDPYTYLPAQPGVGKIIKEARPQVMPIFIAGLRADNLPAQIWGNWSGGPKIRIHFGQLLDLSRFYEMNNSPRTYKTIADYVMSAVAALGENDRAIYAPETLHQSKPFKETAV
ncbi:MAG: lysophospholipid acyltransferase family protein [Acidobacteriota bacterium]|nr:1-acyl-sn-glycerol-3-phosphate acyltransferase [Blastocatellia bacterium]MDW8411312.1 lysophospholipid acyltransferase family protein [Acidobacteriota bacterium]